MVILGVDPGTVVTGYAAIRADFLVGRSPSIVEAGVFRFGRTRDLSARLAELESDLTALIERTNPSSVCVENLFAHSEHPRASLVMAHARGVILLMTRRAGLPLIEVSPATVKKSVAGSGQATKAQMQSAVATLLGLPSVPKPADVADAIAVALCGSRRFATVERVQVERRAGRGARIQSD